MVRSLNLYWEGGEKNKEKVSLQRVLYERGGKGHYRKCPKKGKVIITFIIIHSFDVK